ncbi:hypothetical protein [Neogemmobacter tilapiae]|uniref:Uncharacterized protein n=1 Tax=Neogemmobacter tilapiae TaxID=875041 RepID=A0A918WIL6_9RHOB|nr:hypothetical protein [Gemmobacter tilapiae]GHC49706.1 hypothetical protein GCM10007315_09900 [Gemmobacter tilapiae]
MGTQITVYAGHFKTGSSSLQRFFAVNWRALALQGVLYPATEPQSVAQNMKELLHGAEADDGRRSLNIYEPHNALALRLKNEEDGHTIPDYYPDLPSGKAMLDTMMRQVEALAPKQVLIAGEVLSALAGTPEATGLQRLAWRLEKYEVRVVLNLRRPDLHLASWDIQRLRVGQKPGPLRGEALLDYLQGVHFDYVRLIEAWRKLLPKADFHLRNLADVRKEGGTVEQIVRLLDVPNTGLLTPLEDTNASIPRAYSMICRAARMELSAEASRRIIRAIYVAPAELPRAADREVEMFGRFNRDLMRKEFDKVHVALGKMAGKAPFFPDLDGMLEMGILSDVDAARASWPALRDWLLQNLDDGEDIAWVRGHRP